MSRPISRWPLLTLLSVIAHSGPRTMHRWEILWCRKKLYEIYQYSSCTFLGPMNHWLDRRMYQPLVRILCTVTALLVVPTRIKTFEARMKNRNSGCQGTNELLHDWVCVGLSSNRMPALKLAPFASGGGGLFFFYRVPRNGCGNEFSNYLLPAGIGSFRNKVLLERCIIDEIQDSDI